MGALIVEPLDGSVAELSAAQHGVVSRAQLLSLSVSDSSIRRRVQTGTLHRIHRGVYAVGHRRLTPRGARMAAVLAAGPGALLSHQDAAALWDLSPFGSGLIHVTAPTPGGRARRDVFVVHRSRLHPDDRAEVDGIPVTSVPRTLLDLAAMPQPPALRRLLGEAERLDLLDTSALDALLQRSNGRRGTGRLRPLLNESLEPHAQAASELEHLFLDLLRRAGLPMPQANVLVDGFLVDAFWPEANLVVELDGYEFHRDRQAFERDRRKLAELRLAGREVLALTHRQVTRGPDWVTETVAELIRRGVARLSRAAA